MHLTPGPKTIIVKYRLINENLLMNNKSISKTTNSTNRNNYILFLSLPSFKYYNLITLVLLFLFCIALKMYFFRAKADTNETTLVKCRKGYCSPSISVENSSGTIAGEK